MLPVLLYPDIEASELVGTDLARPMCLVASAPLGHVLFGEFIDVLRTRTGWAHLRTRHEAPLVWQQRHRVVIGGTGETAAGSPAEG